MSTSFEFRGPTRRIARALVETMVPRWPGFELDLTEPVLKRLEATLSAQPRAVQGLVVAGLWGLEVSGPVFGHGFGRLSAVDRDERDRRLTAIAHSSVPTFRQGILLYQTLVNLCAYSMPEVERFLGAERRAWREDRQRLRALLVQLDEPTRAPRTPEALGAHGSLTREAYIEVGAAERAAAVLAARRASETPGEAVPAPVPVEPARPRAPRARRRTSSDHPVRS
jgi:hypothetical protein